MPFTGFSPSDFRVFDIEGFHPRMGAIRSEISPKLEALGAALVRDIARLTGGAAFAHVARHARRTVNPPDDTWVAFGPDTRGYKKHSHFKVAISRRCVRYLFEAGPEHANKKRWTAAWRKQAGRLAPAVKRVKGLAWFKDEHDDEPAAILADLTSQEIAGLGDELLRRRDGQLVLGRLVTDSDAVRWGPEEHRNAALSTFRALAPLYRLR